MRRYLSAFLFAALAGCHGSEGSQTLPNPQCREIATRMAASGESLRASGFPNVVLPAPVDCEFDAQSLQLRCRADYIDNQGSTAVMTKVWAYESIADFVNESSLTGRTTSRSFSSTDSSLGPWALIPDRPIQGSNSFDATGKITSSGELVFTAWDMNGRPTATAATKICDGDTGHRYVYDDMTRQVTHAFNSRTSTRPPDGTVLCIPVVHVTRFDSWGNVSDMDQVHYEVLQTMAICIAN